MWLVLLAPFPNSEPDLGEVMTSSHKRRRKVLGLSAVIVLPPLLYLALLEAIARVVTAGPADVHGPIEFRIGAHVLSVALVAGIVSRLIERRLTFLAVWFAVAVAVGIARGNEPNMQAIVIALSAVAGWVLAIGATALAKRRPHSTADA